MQIIAATQNKHKIKEMNEILAPFGMQLTSLGDVGLGDLEIEETGATCQENSLIKAETVCRLTGKPAIADDTGLMIDALDGAPGVYSARFAGENCTEADNRKKTLALMKDVPEGKRGAKFICVITMKWPEGKVLQATGECPGSILTEERGSNGFGYDSIFLAEETGRSFAEMTDDEKNAISHRGRALVKLEQMLLAQEGNTMDYKERYRSWLADSYFDEADRRELSALTDEKEIEDRFYRDLEFGTAGMRGVMGMGSNRMNKYNIRKASAAFALALIKKHGEEACRSKGVAVAWDSRNNSWEYARETALTFAAYGVPASLYTIVSATPLLSFTVRDLGCVGGVVVTASHNPSEYNGYKAYDQEGCQVLSEDAAAITELYESLDYKVLKSITEDEARKAGLLRDLGEEEMDRFIKAVETTADPISQEAKDDLKIVYTPLFGAGLVPVQKALKDMGYSHVSLVESQKGPDGDFPGLAAPNPEFREAMLPGIEQAEAEGADIVIGSDPDSDRMGLAARDENGEFVLFTGNQIGTLILSYLIERRKDKLDKRDVFISTIVSTRMSFEIAEQSGLSSVSTLTGYKYIGEQMSLFQREQDAGLPDARRFLFAFEESYGFLSGSYARDKDAVFAALKISEMAAYYKALKKPLTAVLKGLYDRYGYFLDKVDSYTLKGKDGAQAIKNISARLRAQGTGTMEGMAEMLDYKDGLGDIPPADVLRFRFSDGSWLAVRPSGTEPKIKFYYSIKAKDEASAQILYQKRKAIADVIVEEESI